MAVLDLTRNRHDLGVVALLVLSRCVDDWLSDDRIARPVRLTRSISIRAIARSLEAPHATIQRHVHKLRADGLIVDVGSGYAIGNDPAHAAIVIDFLKAAHDSLIRLADDFRTKVRFDRTTRARDPGLLAATIAAALDIWLIPFELARTPVTDWTGKLVWIAIAVGNVRHVTTDAALSRLYSDVPTPDELRRPLDARTIALVTRLGYGTVYRHCQKLARASVITYDRGGWLVAARQFEQGKVDRGVRALLGYYCKRINELVALGLDPGHAAGYYQQARPDYVPLPGSAGRPDIPPPPAPLFSAKTR